LADQLVAKGLIASYSDIFHLNKEQVQSLERMGAKSAGNLIAAIEKSKKISFSRFIYALGIRHVGENIADILAGRFESIAQLSDAPIELLETIEGIGPEIAESIRHFFEQDENQKTVQRILESGVEILVKAKRFKASPIQGISFVLTGTLEGMTRNEAKQMIEDAGGKVSSSVSRNTDYLVAGDDPGSKLERAKSLGVRILDKAEFLALIGNPADH